MAGQTSSALNLTSVQLSDNSSTYKCVVANNYGAVTSSIATLTVSGAATLPAFGVAQNLTNNVGNNQIITPSISGTDPKGGFQWYFKGAALSDAGEYSGTQTAVLTITQAATADSGDYELVVTNIAGYTSNIVANLTIKYARPIFVQVPSVGTTFIGRNYTNYAAAYGFSMTYQWYSSKSNGTGPVALSDAGVYSGTGTASLGITGANVASATNYVLVVTNPGGSITSSPVVLNVTVAPAHTFVAYNSIGQNYTQNFNSLIIPYGGSLAGDNPQNAQFIVTNLAVLVTNGNPGVTASLAISRIYSIDNPVDFGYPILTNGFIGGLGLNSTMPGWYGWCQNNMEFGVTFGDQSQGCIMDNGMNYRADGSPLNSITNRALGLIATTKTGANAMGVALVNNTGNSLNTLNIGYLGELWRNNANSQPLEFGYFIDPAGTSSTFHPDVWDATNGIVYVSNLNVVFPTSGSTTINDGTQSSNQVSLAASGLVISNWPPNAVLWLLWRANTLGSAQDVAIDNLSVSATPTVVSVTQPTLGNLAYAGSGAGPGAGAQFSFANTPGAAWQFTVWGTTNLALTFPSQWQNLGHPTENPAGTYNFIDASATNQPQKFYKVTSP